MRLSGTALLLEISIVQMIVLAEMWRRSNHYSTNSTIFNTSKGGWSVP